MDDLIQVAGVHNAQEARILAACGVTHVGFPLGLPVHEEDLPVDAAAAVIRELRPSVTAVLITYLKTAGAICSLARKLGVSAVQVHGTIERQELGRLKAMTENLYVIKSLIVGASSREALIRRVDEFSPFVDAFITDTYDAQTGACGATGKLHDWSVSRELAAYASRPLILAGGLNQHNVGEAIRAVQPAGVDVHTGVEDASGRKSRDRVAAFVKTAREAFAR